MNYIEIKYVIIMQFSNHDQSSKIMLQILNSFKESKVNIYVS